jgi:hypothetical protein
MQASTETITVFAPATIANLGPGFDVLGVAVDGLGDWVSVRRRDDSQVVIESISPALDWGELWRNHVPEKRIAVREWLRLQWGERGGGGVGGECATRRAVGENGLAERGAGGRIGGKRLARR